MALMLMQDDVTNQMQSPAQCNENSNTMRNFSRIRYASYILLIILAIAIIGYLCGCGTYTNYTDPFGPLYWYVSTESPTYHGQQIVVISYNIELGKKLDQVIREMGEDSIWLSADIILLQEAELPGIVQIAQGRSLNYVYYPSAVHSKRKTAFGNAILSRWPLKDPTKIVLPHFEPLRRQNRIGTAATVMVGERDIRVISAHTEMFRMGLGDRLDQIDSLASAIDNNFTYIVVGGDFNTVLHQVLQRFDRSFERIGMLRASEGVASTADVGPLGIIGLHLDHIYTKGFVITGSGVLTETRASDHHPVWIRGRFAGWQ